MDQNNLLSSRFFALSYKQSQKETRITMQLSLPFATTKNIPATKIFLQEYAPSVLKTECFNELNLPFDQEVTNTEIGHLFEHILIDQLCLSQNKIDGISAIVNGRTFWNWEKNPFGKFEIWIDIGKDKINLFLEALRKTILLIENLIQTAFSLSQLSFEMNSRATHKL